MKFKEFIQPSLNEGFLKLCVMFLFITMLLVFSTYEGAIIEGVAIATLVFCIFSFTITREMAELKTELQEVQKR